MDSYEIIVKGHIEKRRFRDVEGIELELLPAGETRILCSSLDQAALYAILTKIRNLGLQLQEVKLIKSPQF